MRVLLLWPYFHPDKSGIACAVRGEAFTKYMGKKGVDVFILVPEKKEVIKKIIEYEGCTVDRVKTYTTIRETHSFVLSLLYLPISVLMLIKKIKKIRPSLIITSTPTPFLPFEGLLAAKLLKVPYIFFMADSWHLMKISRRGTIKNNIKMFLERMCAIHADLIFTVTPTLKKIISSGYNIPNNKIKVVYSGVDLRHYPKLESTETIDLVHLGSPRRYYDTKKLIDAFSLIVNYSADINLAFVGCTNEDYVMKMKQYVDKKGLSKNVEFLNLIPHEKVPYILAKAKIGVISLIDYPEYKSAIGVKVFEYMAAGLPTAYLGPSDSEQEEIIKKNDIGVFSPHPFEFAEVVVNLLNDENLRHIMGKNAKKTITKYDWEQIVNQTFESHISPLIKNIENIHK